ncbi:hypothetical protein OG897_21840 [Streptomyces sp. NBC_00237]|uniref:hypothetical protein n=1 Tax=Streptomyces sp. NBC_00237 TaxID=2975687 RepID=UPI0022519D17|nr:hypothetical protein [Streptomyces sp. NBC_00237]MCX5204079.1 hypothetical protein [Streptomyces sp. NBC_00237]
MPPLPNVTRPAALLLALNATNAAAALPTTIAQAEPRTRTTTHYLDCTSGNDSAGGAPPDRLAHPRQGIHRVPAGRPPPPQARHHLHRHPRPTRQGTPTRLDAHGTGRAKPRIEGDGARAALFLRDSQGFEIRNLNLSNTGPATTTDRRAGLLVLLTDFGRHYAVDRVDVHDVNGSDHKDPDPSGGILFVVQGDKTPTRFDGAPTGSPTVDTLSTYSGNLYRNTAQPRDPQALTADPLFRVPTPATSAGVRLKPASPARGAGTPTPDDVTRNYFGNRIPNPPHLGADQGR